MFSMDHVVIPTISQISPTDIRGALGSVNQLFICIGILAALLAGLPLEGNPIWYSLLNCFILPSCLSVVSCYFLRLFSTEHAYILVM